MGLPLFFARVSRTRRAGTGLNHSCAYVKYILLTALSCSPR
jgi:hypothetical protein